MSSLPIGGQLRVGPSCEPEGLGGFRRALGGKTARPNVTVDIQRWSWPRCQLRADEHSKTPARHRLDLGEAAAGDSGSVDLLERGLTTIGGVGEHVVDGKQPALHDVRRPILVVVACGQNTVSAVDEKKRERGCPGSGNGERCPDDRYDAAFESGSFDSPAKDRERVHSTGVRIDEFAVVVLPARLVLFGAAVVVDAEKQRGNMQRGGAEVDRRFAAIGTHLKYRAFRTNRRSGVVEGQTFVVGHETLRRASNFQDAWFDHLCFFGTFVVVGRTTGFDERGVQTRVLPTVLQNSMNSVVGVGFVVVVMVVVTVVVTVVVVDNTVVVGGVVVVGTSVVLGTTVETNFNVVDVVVGTVDVVGGTVVGTRVVAVATLGGHGSK